VHVRSKRPACDALHGVRAAVTVANAVQRITGRAFRAYVHSPAAMDAVLTRNGLRRRWAGGTFIWAAEVFER
jgi:hypothetical protein